MDKPDARITEVVNEVFDLFAALDATDEQLDFPIIYGSAKQGWMADEPTGPQDGMAPLFDLVVKHVPQPKIEEGGFRLLGTLLEANPYLGRIVTGRVFAGSVKPNQQVKVLDREGKVVENGRISKILAFRGIERQPIEEAEAGDIVAIAGLEKFNVADTLCALDVNEPLQAQRELEGPGVRGAERVVVDQRLLAGMVLVHRQSVADIGADIDAVDIKHLDIVEPRFRQGAEIVGGQFVTGLDIDLTGLGIDQIQRAVAADHLVLRIAEYRLGTGVPANDQPLG